jgi:hypothetical protein
MSYFVEAYQKHQNLIRENPGNLDLINALYQIQPLSIKCLQLQTIAGLLAGTDPHPIDPNRRTATEAPPDEWVDLRAGNRDIKENRQTIPSSAYDISILQHLFYDTVRKQINGTGLFDAIWQRV